MKKKLEGDRVRVSIDRTRVAVKSIRGGKNKKDRVTDVTVEAYVTPDQKVLADIAYDVAHRGKNRKAKIVVEELARNGSVLKTYVYGDCMLVSLDYPSLDIRRDEPVCDVCVFRPTTLAVS